jgi:hypothetical protein
MNGPGWRQADILSTGDCPPILNPSKQGRMKTRLLIRALALVFVIGTGSSIARASHEAGNAENAAQKLTSNADQVIAPSAAATPLAGCGADPAREEADLVVVSGSGRVGDSTTSSSSGDVVNSGNPPLRLEATNQLFAYSDGGAVISCSEINR